MKHKGIWISLLIGVLLCAVASGIVGWRWSHPQPYCKVEQSPGFLEYEMCTDKKEYQLGDPIYVTFTIKNISADADRQEQAAWEFGNGVDPAMDICEPWGNICWSDEQILAEDDRHFVLKPQESHTLTWTWPTTPEQLNYLKEQQSQSNPYTCRGMSMDGYWTWPPQGELEPIFSINFSYNCR